jgi:hypothetical protein
MESNSISIIEYLSVFTTFIYGYVCTRFFSGWSAMITFRRSIEFSKEHLFWTLLAFGLLIDVWWGSWNKTYIVHEHIVLYYYSLVSPMIFYVISVTLFPLLSDEKFLDMRVYFHQIEKRNYLAFGVLFLSFVFDSIFFDEIPKEDVYYNAAAISLAICGYFSRSPLFNRFILGAGWVLLIVHMVLMPPITPEKSIIRNFTVAEYLTVFIAFIYGFIASRFLSGWAIILMQYNRISFYKEHLAWTFLSFILLVDMWTGSWQRESFLSLGVHYFILSLLVPLAFYILTTIMFPIVKLDEDRNLRVYFLSHKKMIFLFFGIIILVNGITALSMEQELVHMENIFRLLALLLALVALLTSRPIIERSILFTAGAIMILHVMLQPYIE